MYSRAESYIVRYRFDGVPKKLTLGSVLEHGVAEPDTTPAIGSPLSLASARELATQALRAVAAGRDPAEDKKQRREQQHAAKADSLEAVCKEHLRREAAHNLRTLEKQRGPDFEL